MMLQQSILSCTGKMRYKNIDISRCLKQYLLYSFLENFINEEESLSLNSLIFLIDEPIIEENYNNSEKLLEFLSQKILKTKENTTFDLIEYVQSKRRLKEYKISKKFFFIFILCTNFFDKLQRDIGLRILVTFTIENKLNFKHYAQYYLFFKDNQSLNIENKLNFITKFLYIVDSGCNEDKDPEVIQKFKNDNEIKQKINKDLLAKINSYKNEILLLKNKLKYNLEKAKNKERQYSTDISKHNLFNSFINYDEQNKDYSYYREYNKSVSFSRTKAKINIPIFKRYEEDNNEIKSVTEKNILPINKI